MEAPTPTARRRRHSQPLVSPASPMSQYFTRKRTSRISTHDLPMEKNAIGQFSPAGIFFTVVKLTVPLAYIYIALILWRELCYGFPQTLLESHFMKTYFCYGIKIARTMRSSSLAVEVWAIIEGVFFVCLFLHRLWLNSLDTLELSLRCAPMLECRERAELWRLMVDNETECVDFIQGWFCGEKMTNLTRYDVSDFLTWSMFEGRNLEHLTHEELAQLRGFVDDLEYRISIELYGVDGEGSLAVDDNDACDDGDDWVPLQPRSPNRRPQLGGLQEYRVCKKNRLKPRKTFRFQESREETFHATFFSNLYESYKEAMDGRNFRPVEALGNLLAEKRHSAVATAGALCDHLHNAEQNAVYAAGAMYENAYFALIKKDGPVDKQLTKLSHATQSQISDLWNSMLDRTASDISARRKRLRQQLRGYQQTLANMRKMAIPPKQMAELMKKITQCYEALDSVESSAKASFIQLMNLPSYVGKTIFQRHEPPRYLKFSQDPLMDVESYPLIFHLIVLLICEGGLRFLMWRRGFKRLRVGPISYYHHPGNRPPDDTEQVPIVFCHGIGIGVIFYLPLIDELLRLGRPLILPEISFVSGFRIWQGPNSVLPPAAVSGTLMSILACHGYERGAFMGHSYGTSWVSFMCKYSPQYVAAVLFLDPVCFCLHWARLTRKFVYHRADPGSTSHMIRTDVNVNWTIQRGFPWARISLFTEQIPCVPCSIFLSEKDALVPTGKVERYLISKGAKVLDSDVAGREHFSSFGQSSHPINVTVFRDHNHGEWPLVSACNKQVAQATEALVSQIDTVN